ncbi:23S rRNA pseudouridine(1911/1915/1917) synthase [Gammaproteobacteria bacterium]
MSESLHLQAHIPDSLVGQRLDQAMVALFPEYSRNRLQTWIRDGSVRVDGNILRPRDRVYGGEFVELLSESQDETPWTPEEVPLEVVYSDSHLLVVDKPAGWVVHPGAGNANGTLVNALLHHVPELSLLPRAGLIHRLDKDTTGLLVVARTLEVYYALTKQLQKRTILREYEALVNGVVLAGGKVEAPLGRHPIDRTKIAVVPGGRPAVTHYWVIRRFSAHTHLRLRLETGRTHQIRVHMAHLHYPVVGDPVYGGRVRVPAGASETLITALQSFQRQALHAARLGFTHPVTEEEMEWQSPLPADFQNLLKLVLS